MRNVSIGETWLIAGALASIANLLPASWHLPTKLEPMVSGRRADSVVTLTGPSGANITFQVESKKSGTASRLLLAVLRERASATSLPLLFVSDYIGPSLRASLAGEGISYADATGWVRIVNDLPLILLTGQGAQKSPGAGKSATLVRLNGVAASRIIRTLCTEETPRGVRDLASIADVSPGSVSKLLPTLVNEGIVDRDKHGGVNVVRRRALIRRWVIDYSFARTNRSVGYFIAPRGIGRALGRLSELSVSTTMTGSAAARTLLPEGIVSVVPLRLLSIYTDSPRTVIDELGLIPSEPATANTVVAIPQDVSVLNSDVAPTALVLADLLTLPSRGDAEAEQLMDTLSRQDGAWAE